MANTYTLIESQVLGSTTASVTFSAIPATYTDLVLKCSARSTGTSYTMRLKINGTAGSYSATLLQGSGSAASSAQGTEQAASYQYGGVNLSTYTANTYASCEIYIPSYLVSQNKPFSSFAVNETNATAVDMFAHASLWSNTAAITTLELSLTGGNSYTATSSFNLYGISNTI